MREFVDAADAAYLEGNAHEICRMRSDDFTLTSVVFDLTGSQIVADAAAAEEVAAGREEAGERIDGKSVTLNLQKFCKSAYDEIKTNASTVMTRGDLRIEIDPSAAQAIVYAHYSIKIPVYGAGQGTLSERDEVETQFATRQLEADDRSVVALRDGQLRFVSTQSTSRTFLIPKEVHDDRL